MHVEHGSQQKTTYNDNNDNKTPFDVHIVIGSYLLKVATNSEYKVRLIMCINLKILKSNASSSYSSESWKKLNNSYVFRDRVHRMI